MEARDSPEELSALFWLGDSGSGISGEMYSI